MSPNKKLLFVCSGNIIRSPLAEHLFRKLAEQAGLDSKYSVDSAGTSSYHVGESPDARMRRTAAEHGLEYDGRARQVEPYDLQLFDLILAMDRHNFNDLLAMAASEDERAKVRMMRSFDPESEADASVPDPYYGGHEGFTRTYRIVERSVDGLIDALERGEV
jgi:protein-tyrosine phosphatase